MSQKINKYRYLCDGHHTIDNIFDKNASNDPVSGLRDVILREKHFRICPAYDIVSPLFFHYHGGYR